MAEYTATSGSYTTTLTVTEGAYDIASNTSPVTFTLTLKKNSGTGLWNNDSCPWSININGTSYSGSFTYDFRNYSSLTLKSSTTQTITHDSDGTKKIAVSASVNMDNTPYVYTMSPSGELTLATIPRASDIALSVSSFSITSASGNAFSWSITAKSNSFYNRLRYSIGNKSNVSSNKGQGSSSGYFTNQELLSALPTSTSGSLTVYCDTYSDSGYSNLIGSKSVVITVSVNTSYIKPSVSLGNIGINSSPISGYAVAGHSKVQSAWSTSNSYGATSVTTYFTVSTGSLATTSSSSTSGTVVSNVIPSNASNYTLTIYAYAKDSRGAVSSTVNQSITVYGYQPPTANLTAYRTSSSSSTSEDGAGTYAYVTFSGAVRSSVNSQNTIQSTVCTYSGSISGTATNGGHYALADTQTVTFKLTVTDKVTSSTASVTIATASYPLDLYDDGNGNVGMGIGAVAVANKTTSALPVEAKYYVSTNVLNTAHLWSMGSGSKYIKIKINSAKSWMLSFTVQIYSAYKQSQIRISGYNYGTNYWFSPRAEIISSSDQNTVSVTFGYDSAWNLWVCVPVSNYYGINITDVVNGYIQVIEDLTELFTLTEVTSIPTTVQSTVVAYHTANSATTATSATNATNATNASYASDLSVNSLTSGADLNNNTYLSKVWVSGSSTITSSLVNKPSGANDTLWVTTLPHNKKTPAETWFYATQVAFDTNGEMFVRSIVGSGTAGSHSFGVWGKVEIANTIWTGTLKGGNTLNLAVSNYRRLRVFVRLYGVNAIYDIDLQNQNAYEQISGYRYSNGCAVAEYTAGGTLELLTSQCMVNTAKTVFRHYHCGYQAGASATTRDNDTNYYVYRIDGII